MLRMVVEGVGFDHLKQTVVVLKDWESQKLLPIWIGPSEAKAIALELEGAVPGRPLSHDLLLSIIQLAQGTVAQVVINDLQDATFYATIDIETPEGTRNIDARPSDAIAIAVRAKCPLFVDGAAQDALIEMSDVVTNAHDETAEDEPLPDFEEADTTPQGDQDEIERFKRLLGDLGD
jgi:bifunctional DNase/RNase